MLQTCFLQLLHPYTQDSQQTDQLWKEIVSHYTHKGRYYHTLAHLEQLLQQLLDCKEKIDDWETVLLALFYHDVIYNPVRQDNEEKSAALAVKRLETLAYPLDKTARCSAHILATKRHLLSDDPDTNLFTDADLSILGADPDAYTHYYQNIRKEYALYPDFLYNPGRVNVLQHFLQMERIFKTAHFYDHYEQHARLNITTELKLLH